MGSLFSADVPLTHHSPPSYLQTNATPSEKPAIVLLAPLKPILCNSPKTKVPIHAYDTMIKVTVGTSVLNRNTFEIYRGLICHFSTYFDRMLNGNFREGGSTEVKMHDTDRATFQLFYAWLNTGTFAEVEPVRGKPGTPRATRYEFADHIDDFINLYLFADYIGCQPLQNDIMDALFLIYSEEKYNLVTFIPVLLRRTTTIYENTVESDPIRNLVVDLAVEGWDFTESNKDMEDYDNEFFMDYLRKLKLEGRIPGSAPSCCGYTWRLDTMHNTFCSRYHIHEGEMCDAVPIIHVSGDKLHYEFYSYSDSDDDV